MAEPVACLSHVGGGILFCLVALSLLPRVRGDRRRFIAFVAYVFGVGGMFFASGAYHLLDAAHPLHGTLWHLDHGMIWLAIAGTISMFLVLECPGQPHLQMGLWAIALTGLVCEGLFLQELSQARWASPLLYIAMGWFGIVPLRKIYQQCGWRGAAPLLVAGLLSTAGGLVDGFAWPSLTARIVEAHEVMHVLILTGMLTFEWAVYERLLLTDQDTAPETFAALAPA